MPPVPPAKPDRMASNTESASSTLPRSSAAAMIALHSGASRAAPEPPAESATMSSAWSASPAPETRLSRSVSSHPATGSSDEVSPAPSPSPPAAPVLCREQQPEEGWEKNARPKLAAVVTRVRSGEETGRSERRWDAGEGGRRASAMDARAVRRVSGKPSSTWRAPALDEVRVVQT